VFQREQEALMSIHEINPEELRRYIKNHNEKEYLLVDVRQPDEYEEGHIPGARLLPLPDHGRFPDSGRRV
jgi:rhodanese-related sulfurtransferase